MSVKLTGRPWRRLRTQLLATWAATNQPCALCGQPIDYTLRHPHPQAPTIDHRTPRWAGGNHLDPTNCQPAHHTCNSRRGAREGNTLRTRPRHTSSRW